jgi:hypothetical protein
MIKNIGINSGFLIILILANLTFTTNSVLNLKKDHPYSDYDNYFQNIQIKNIKTTFILDSKSQSCNIKVKEKISFQLDSPTDVIKHFLVSKRNPFFNIKASISDEMNKQYKIIKTETYTRRGESSYLSIDLRQPIPIHEAWIISTTLSKPVQEITLYYEYTIQRGLGIDTRNEKNILNIDLINGYPFKIDGHQINIEIWNFPSLKQDHFFLIDEAEVFPISSNSLDKYSQPQDKFSHNITDINNYISNIHSLEKGYEIILTKSLPEHSGFSLTLQLPMEILLCEISIFTFFYYFLLALGGLFFFIGTTALLMVYKD